MSIKKVVCISDTHSLHDQVIIPESDLLIHAGDVTGNGSISQFIKFVAWFSEQPCKYKIFIGGNHDAILERLPIKEIRAYLPKNVYYLENDGIELEGLKIWGSPVTPTFLDWYFMANRGSNISKYWERIPNKLDFLITHGPLYGVLDKTPDDKNVGCEELLKSVFLKEPRYHVFGHIHQGYGWVKRKNTLFINCSVLNEDYKVVNYPTKIILNKIIKTENMNMTKN
jgi:Icc-related predicted phosphoesterase